MSQTMATSVFSTSTRRSIRRRAATRRRIDRRVDVEKTDVAIVCDIYTPIDTPPRGRYEREIDWLKRMRDGGAILASVCSGSLILAEAGLLDGIECAGHWGYRNLFREHYPN